MPAKRGRGRIYFWRTSMKLCRLLAGEVGWTLHIAKNKSVPEGQVNARVPLCLLQPLLKIGEK